MSYNFADHFWELDFTGTIGFEVLVKKLKDGKKMTQDFEDFLRARAKLEESYAKDLLKLVKSAHGETEIGSLRASWDCVKTEMEASSREHLAVAQHLSAELEKTVKDFKEKQREVRKKAEDTVRKAQAFKKNSFQTENKHKQEYFNKCRAADRAEELATKSGHLQPKKIEELRQKAKKARLAAEQSDVTYQETVENLDRARLLWEREMEVCCKIFQDVEEERILFLRCMMWRLCNVYSSLAVRDDEYNEVIRCSLEQCDADSDLMLFVQQKRTGCDRPVPIEYEGFYGGRGQPQLYENNPAATVVAGRPGLAPAPAAAAAAAMPIPQHPGHAYSSVGAATHAMPTLHQRSLPQPPGTAPVQEALIAFDDGAYSVIPQGGQAMHPGHRNGNPLGTAVAGGAAAPTAGGVNKCRANFPYDAQGPEELSFKEGDILFVLVKEDKNWWMGELRGRQGMFPCTYVTEF